jgi:hypothetical protein
MKWKQLPENFNNTVSFVSLGCASGLLNPKLICIHVNEKGFIESSDNSRIIHCKVENIPVKTFLIPGNSAELVIKYKPVKIAQEVDWVHFKNEEGTIISCRTFNDTFVDTSQFLNLKSKNKIEFPTNINDILENAIVFVKKESSFGEFVNIHIENNQIIVSSKTDFAWFEQKQRIKYSGDKVQFLIKPNLLKDILTKTNICYLLDKMLLFKGEDWLYLTTIVV